MKSISTTFETPPKVSPTKVGKSGRGSMDHGFSRPVPRSETKGDHAPTQIISEVVKKSGYDGVACKSMGGGENGHNVALFDLDAASMVKCGLYDVRPIDVGFDEISRPWCKNSPEPQGAC